MGGLAVGRTTVVSKLKSQKKGKKKNETISTLSTNADPTDQDLFAVGVDSIKGFCRLVVGQSCKLQSEFSW